MATDYFIFHVNIFETRREREGSYRKAKYLKFLQGILNVTPKEMKKIRKVIFGRTNVGGKNKK